MDNSENGLYIIILISLSVALFAHILSKKFWLATICSTFVSVALFQLMVIIQLGHIDKFILVAVITTSIISFVISAFIGIIKNYIYKRVIKA